MECTGELSQSWIADVATAFESEPSGRFDFYKGITLSLDAWRALPLLPKQEIRPRRRCKPKESSNKPITR
jgi:hypothetical protein